MEELKACIFNIQRFSLHDGPGIRTTIFFKGCPLNCSWCSNPESQSNMPEVIWDNIKKTETISGKFYTVNEVIDVIKRDMDYYEESGGGITVTGGEILMQSKFVIDLLNKCRQKKIHTTCETSAYSSNNQFKTLISSVDLLIMDIKHYDSVKHKEKTGGHLGIVLSNLDLAIKSKKEMIVRIPIIPNFNDSLKDAKEFGKLLKQHDLKKIELLPFHQFGKSKYKFLNRQYEFENFHQIKKEELTSFSDIIQQYGIDCKIG